MAQPGSADETLPAIESRRVSRATSWQRSFSRARLAILRVLLEPLDRVLAAQHGYRTFIWIVSFVPPPLLAKVGRWRALRTADHALRRIPAYRQFA